MPHRAEVNASPLHVTLLLTLVLGACAHEARVPAPASPVSSSGPHLVALDATTCRTLLRDDAPSESLHQAIARSLDYLSRQPADRVLPALDRHITVAELVTMLTTLNGTPNDEWAQLCDRFRLYRAEVPDGVLVTGYYQPELTASRKRTERFRYPLYRTPDDLIDVDLGEFCPACGGRVTQARVRDGKLVPYSSRSEIEAGLLDGRDLELAWLDDPVEAYFLHVQGSALLRLEDGVLLQISYSSSNGRPYTSIGRVLIEQGKMARDAVSLQSLKDYLRAHPDEQATLMGANQRYIFFRTVVTGPIGSLGVPLTAGRSVAADPALYPAGGLAFLHIAPRDPPARDQRSVTRLGLIHDAGAAISGPGRIDVYWGTGATAEEIAGNLRNPGEMYLVLPQ